MNKENNEYTRKPSAYIRRTAFANAKASRNYFFGM